MGLARSRKEALDQFGNAIAARFAGPNGDADDGAADTADVDLQSPYRGTPLGEVLVGMGAVSESQLHYALLAQTNSGVRLGEILVTHGALTVRAFTLALGAQLGLPVVDLARETVDPEAAMLLPEDVARRLCAIPVRMRGGRIDVAVAEPATDRLLEQLIDALDAPVRLVLAPRDHLEWNIDNIHRSRSDIGDALRVFEERAEERRRNLSDNATAALIEVDEDAPVVKVVNVILEQAVRDRASDVHIEPQSDSVIVRLRIDGALHDLTALPRSMAGALVSRVKVLADMNIVERRRPQDGQMEISVDDRSLDVRVATSTTVHGEMCVMRILDKSRAFFNLGELGMPADTYELYRSLIHSPYGMVICAGPTGSGKTTTLYASLAEVNNTSVKVSTIEDPVEYVIPRINQLQINEQAGVTFASGLRALLRQDPDTILVGEIRDVETAAIAVQAALTGHFVMSSLHATDASAAMHRFVDMGIEPFLLTSSLLGVVGQRLVRRNCPHCVEPYLPTFDELQFFDRFGSDIGTRSFRRGMGCNFCGKTGYFERVGVYEVLRVTDEMRNLIVRGAQHNEIFALAVAQGMTPLRDQAARLVAEGVTTIAEVLRTVYVL